MNSGTRTSRQSSTAVQYEPRVVRSDPAVCHHCRHSGAPWFPILNTNSGKYHSGGEYGQTDCGVDATGDNWLWPI